MYMYFRFFSLFQWGSCNIEYIFERAGHIASSRAATSKRLPDLDAWALAEATRPSPETIINASLCTFSTHSFTRNDWQARALRI